MAENSSSHRQHGPRPNVGNNLPAEGMVEEASDDNEVQSNGANDPVTPGIFPINPAQSILPPGETPISWYVRSQGALNAVYTQLCAQTAPVTQSRRPGSRAHASQREESTYDGTNSYQRQHHESQPRQRQSVHDRLGSPWDAHTDESDQTYRLSANTSVFNRLHPNSNKSRPRAVYNPEAEHNYDLVYRPAEAAENSKFILEIALAPLERAKLPSNVGKFNGLTDPDNHLRVFTSAGLVGGWTLPLWCHLFVQTLTGPARIWFDNLPTGQIESWKDLRQKFLTHFSQQRRSMRDTSDVMNIWRRDDENLEDFITRYNKEVLGIGGVHEQLIRAQFKYAVRCDDMVKVLSRTEGLPKSWEKIMAAAKVYAQTEKNLTTNRPPPPHSRPTDLSATGERRFKKSWRESSGSRSSEDARGTINKLSAQRENKHENRERQWTPLTKTPTEVLSTEDYQFKPPIPMKSKRGQDLAQYCEYHKDTGHTTNNCISLRTEIEKALKNGEFAHLLQNMRKEIKQITRGEETSNKWAKT
ncbi:uncharacterized protein LOC110869890 [Helianthus annuus]|uniref:uncharacterized protein LOC110869890 n=1 Tax=Helianthus annuus TaxID=4232 RepID=UPI000B8F5143|nr:uncharacterized protein LOC110869890 [Helianthus annuus]